MSRFALAALVMLAACGTDVAQPDVPDAIEVVPDAAAVKTACEEAELHSDLAWIQQHVFTPSCATAACHDADEPEVYLSVADGMAYSNLVNVGASTVDGWKRVVPGSPGTSYLMVALGRAEGPPPRDGFMPLLAEPLCAEKLAAIERWIAQGAAR